MICDLTGMEIANASLLDEATAAAEAMAHGARASARRKSDVIAVGADLHPQTRAVLATRARAARHDGWSTCAPGDPAAIAAAKPFAVLLQYPGTHRRGARPDARRSRRRMRPARWRSSRPIRCRWRC